MSSRKLKNQKSNYAISEEQLIQMHKPRFDIKDSTVLVCQILFWIIPNLCMESYITYKDGIFIRTYYLTLIGAFLATSSWIISAYLTYTRIKGVEVSYTVRRLNHLLFEAAFTFQILITAFYWAITHHFSREKYQSKGIYHVYYIIFVHTLPMVWIGAEFLLTSQVVFLRDLKYSLLFGLIYSFNHFLQTKLIEGRRPYPFMTWESWDSLVSVGVFMTFYTIIYFISTKLTNRQSKNSKDKEV